VRPRVGRGARRGAGRAGRGGGPRAAARGEPVEAVGRLRGAAPVKPLPVATEAAP
jgi:hypothetical protein